MTKFNDPVEQFVEGFKEGSKGFVKENFPTPDMTKGSKFRARLRSEFKFMMFIGACLLGYILYTGIRRGW